MYFFGFSPLYILKLLLFIVSQSHIFSDQERQERENREDQHQLVAVHCLTVSYNSDEERQEREDREDKHQLVAVNSISSTFTNRLHSPVHIELGQLPFDRWWN